MIICDKCRENTGGWCPEHSWWNVPIQFVPQPKPCEHCYCEKSHDQSHKRCCNCGNQQLILK